MSMGLPSAWPQRVVALIVTLAASFPSRRAQGQQIIDGELFCRGEQVSLRETAPSTTRAYDALRKQAEKLNGLVAAVEQQKLLADCGNRCLPGQVQVNAVLNDPAGTWRSRFSDSEFHANLLRVLAHRECSTKDSTATHAEIEACAELLRTEGVDLTQGGWDPGSLATTPDSPEWNAAIATAGLGNDRDALGQVTSCDDAAVAASKCRDAKCFQAKWAKSPTRCLADPIGPEHQNALKVIATYYGQDRPEVLGRDIDSIVRAARTSLRLLPPSKPCSEADLTCPPPSMDDSCRQSALYFNALGQVGHGGASKTACLDVAGASARQPISIFMSPPGALTTNKGWLGEAIAIAWPDEEVVRATFWAYPDGYALRVLAAREGLLKPTASGTQSTTYADFTALLSEHERLTRDRKALGMILDWPEVANSLANALTRPNTEFQKAILAITTARADSTPETKDKLVASAQDALLGATIDWSGRDLRRAAFQIAKEVIAHFPSAQAKPGEWPQLKNEIQLFSQTVRDMPLPASLKVDEHTRAVATYRADEQKMRAVMTNLCGLSKQQYPIMVHDILQKPNAAVVDYDFERGFVSTSRTQFDEDEFLHVRVSNVPGSAAIAVALDSKEVLVNQSPIVGLRAPGKANVQKAEGDSPSTELPLLAEASPQFRGTRVVKLGKVPGGRTYSLAVSERKQTNRTIAANNLTINGDFDFGAVAGFGASAVFPGSPVPVRNDSTGTLWTTRKTSANYDVALPVALVWYAVGRNVPKTDFTLGIGLGVDALNPTKRFILPAFSIGVGGVGLTVGSVVDITDTPRVQEGATVQSPTSPDLTSSFGKRPNPRVGVIGALTFDLDLFRMAFNSLVGGKLPEVQ